MSERTNATTADLATRRRALPLRSLQLIGIFGTADAPRALLRSAGGQVTTVSIGDSIRQGTIVAIAQDRLILSTGTGERTLRLPQHRAAA